MTNKYSKQVYLGTDCPKLSLSKPAGGEMKADEANLASLRLCQD